MYHFIYFSRDSVVILLHLRETDNPYMYIKWTQNEQ